MEYRAIYRATYRGKSFRIPWDVLGCRGKSMECRGKSMGYPFSSEAAKKAVLPLTTILVQLTTYGAEQFAATSQCLYLVNVYTTTNIAALSYYCCCSSCHCTIIIIKKIMHVRAGTVWRLITLEIIWFIQQQQQAASSSSRQSTAFVSYIAPGIHEHAHGRHANAPSEPAHGSYYPYYRYYPRFHADPCSRRRGRRKCPAVFSCTAFEFCVRTIIPVRNLSRCSILVHNREH